MAKTAYSTKYRRELDVEQLLALYGNHSLDESLAVLSNIPDRIRDMVSVDMVCPCCGVGGAVLVSGAKSAKSMKSLRQAHFRFVGDKGEEAHRPFCEYVQTDNEQPSTSELVDFGSPRTKLTRLVREVVCKGIESNVFDQSNIRSMRQWYFDTKAESRFKVTSSEHIFDSISDICGHNYRDELVHHPVHAEIANFDWNYAAKVKFSQDSAELLEAIYPLKIFPHKANAKKLIKRFKGKDVFDVEVLKPYYQNTVRLCSFAGRSFGFPPTDWANYKNGSAPSELLALCSLLLSISEWDINVAIEKLVKIIASPEPQSLLHGNIIGLNPFLDYGAWIAVKNICWLEERFVIPQDYKAKVGEIESKMRAEHLLWREAEGLPEPINIQKQSVKYDENTDPFA